MGAYYGYFLWACVLVFSLGGGWRLAIEQAKVRRWWVLTDLLLAIITISFLGWLFGITK